LLAEDALEHLLGHFADEDVGGVCGQRVLGEPGPFLGGAQGRYVSMDSLVKKIESVNGSITSNDGKLYAIRKECFRPIPGTVTDDLFVGMNVVAQRKRFIFEPRARAFIRTPSRGTAHELSRRRRIVARSLTGIFLMRRLLNPLRFGRYSVGLAINKVTRRALPVCMLAILATSALLAASSMVLQVLLWLQVAFYVTALSHLALRRKVTSVAFLFCLGNLGTLLGLVDFLRGKRVAKWEPLKAD
jgi:cellulose synthase/poly-beta-1,6-N-acetylglucosamine synthase-like glycosyltransferase